MSKKKSADKTNRSGGLNNNNQTTNIEPNSSRRFIKFLNERQKQAWDLYNNNQILFLTGPAGSGKTFISSAFAVNDILNKSKETIYITRPLVEAGESMGFLPGPQPLDAKILTPYGWTTMGELKVGDLVIGRDGKATQVLKIFPKGKKMVYKISTTDNTSTEACEDHLWLTQTFQNRKRFTLGTIKTTKQIADTLLNKNGKLNHFLPRNEPIEFEKSDLPIPPYVLGCLLGDGSLGNNVSLTNTDQELLQRVNDELVESLNCSLSNNGNNIQYHVKHNINNKKTARKLKITNLHNQECTEYCSIDLANQDVKINKSTLKERCRKNRIVDGYKYEFVPLKNRWNNPIKNTLDELNLTGTKAFDKFIPAIYKYSSIQDRIDLLRGLLDTDGNVNKGKASFTTISKQLAKDIVELVQSLGGRAVIRSRDRRNETEIHTINGREIKSKHIVYEFNVSLPSNINPFYISRKANKYKSKYIQQVRIKSIEPICEKEVQCIMLDNSEHLYITDQYIVTHNTADEKTQPFMIPIFDCIAKVCGPKDTGMRTFLEKKVEISPLCLMRGRTFQDSVCILDEAQNCTKGQLKLFLTRIGENCKMIITGDLTQSDLFETPDLKRVLENLEGVQGIAHINFEDTDIVRNPLIAEIIKRI